MTRKPVTTATPAIFQISPGRPSVVRLWGSFAGSTVSLFGGLLDANTRQPDLTTEIQVSGWNALAAGKEEPVTLCAEYLRAVRTGGAGVIELAVAPVMPN